MSSQLQSVGESFSKVENEWVVLDRMLHFAVTVAPFFKGTKYHNATHLSLHLCHFENLCGFTKQVCANLFAKPNMEKRNICERHGVKFVITGQEWHTKQIVVEYNNSLPSFAVDFGAPAAVIPAFANAPVGNDQLPAPAVPAVGAENVPPVPALNIEHHDGDTIIVRCKNNKRKHYYAIPTAAGGQIASYEQFYHAVTANRWKDILKRLAGDTKVGVKMLTMMLHGIDRDECLKGLNECGSGVFKTLSPAQTLAMMARCGFSWSQMRKLKSFFMPFNNNVPLWASEKDCQKLYVVDLPLQFDTYNSPKGSTDYWRICPWEALLSTIKKVRDVPDKTGRKIGVKQVIPVVIQGDYGGDLGKGEMKFLQVVILREGCSYPWKVRS
jgi:hypothetical protein